MHFTRRQATRRQALSALLCASSLLGLRGPAGALVPRPRPGTRARRREAAALLDAVRRGDLAVVRRLLAEDASLAGATDEDGRSAFVLAWLAGQVEVASVLADARSGAGLELDVVEAVLAEDWGRFESLAEQDPEGLNRAHPIGGTPLYAAACVGSLGGWRLRSAGARSDEAPEGGNGYTPARGALESPRSSWARIGLSDICSNGGDVNAPQRGGSSVLHAAVARRDELLVRLAVRKGADTEALDDAGRTPRALAAEIGWAEGEALLARVDSLPRDNRSSRFALDANREPVRRPDLSDVPRERQGEVTGSSHRDLDRVRELVSADERLVFSISADDELAIEACAHTGAREIIRFHLDHGAPLSLPTAASLGDLEAMRFWLDRDPTLIHERGAHDFPVLWYAVLGGPSLEVAELLLERGAPVDQESVGTTALHWCVRRGASDLARLLLDAGADPEAVGHRWSREGQTPLEVARQDDRPALARLLKDAGARR